MRRRLTLILGLLFSAFFAWVGFRGLQFDQLWQALRQIEWAWLIPAVAVYFLAAYILTWRWHYLLVPLKPVHANRLFPIVVIGYMGNNIYPARIGELIRAYVLRRNEGIPYAPSLVVILAERVFDGMVLLFFIVVALQFVQFEAPVLQAIITVTGPLFVGGLLVFSLFALRPDWARQIYTPLVKRLLPGRLEEKVLALAEQVLAGMAALRDPRLLLLTWACSMGSWIIEASTYWIVLHAFDFSVSFFVLVLVMGLANLTTILPSTPGYVGTFHGVIVLTLGAFEVAGEQAGAYAIIMHMVLWLPITVAGMILLWRQGLSWRDLSRAETEATA